MPETPAAREVSIQEAKARFEDLIADVEAEDRDIVIKDAGRPVVRITPLLTRHEAAHHRFFKTAADLRRSFAHTPTRELQAAIDAAVQEVRAQRHKARG